MKKNIALVLSGGAARGIAHIGVIEELINHGYNITSIAGNSMGALIGAIYAVDKLEEFKEWILNLNKVDIFSMLDFSFSKQGLIKGDKILKRIKPFFGNTKIEELNIPFVAVASDITNMNEYVFSSGLLYKAVRASISIPTIFTPVKIKNSILVDGGLVNPIPINRIIRTKDDLLVGVYVNANIELEKEEIEILNSSKKHLKKEKDFNKTIYKVLSTDKKRKLNYFSVLNKSVSLLTQTLSERNIADEKPDVLIRVSSKSAGFFDFFKAQQLIDIGKFQARKILMGEKL